MSGSQPSQYSPQGMRRPEFNHRRDHGLSKWVVIAALALAAASAAPRPFSAPKNALIVGRVLDAGTGRVIPCTVTIGAGHNKIIIGNAAVAGGFRSNGRFAKAVPPGDTTITVSRGFDYLAQQQTLNLRPAQRVQLIFRLHRQSTLRRMGWYCGDNHVHMIHGAEKVAVDFSDVVLTARAAGLDYMS
ncbi:MAG: hypothetical protein ACREP9_05550, partial [Candidatus Dormibacteraceae bacterium]